MNSILSICLRRFYSARKNLEELLLKMPKDTTEHVQRNQKQRIRIREKSKFYSPGTVNLQVLGSGARGSSSSIYLFSEQARYLFNCSEGTQRLAHEHRTKLTRMEHIFLSRKSWSRFGGVPGLCLTLQEIGVPKLNLHGPPGIAEIFQSTRKFVVLRNMKVETPECKAGGFWEDSVMRVNYVPLQKEKTSDEKVGETVTEVEEKSDDWNKDDTDYFEYEKNSKKSDEKSAEEMKKKKIPIEIESEVMAYICKLQERPGTLDFTMCVEKGVPPGPLLGRLKNGFDVTLPDGSTVKANDVRGQSQPGTVFIFVDIPDESYLPALKSSKAFKPHQKWAATDDERAIVVVHFSPEEMMINDDYRAWIEDFSPSTKHLFVNERNEFTGFFASHRIQRQLNELSADVFPMLKERHPYLDSKKSDESISEAEKMKRTEKKFAIDTKPDKFSEYPELGILSTFHIRPNKGFDRNLEPYSNPEKVMEDTLEQPQLRELIATYKTESKALVEMRTKEQRSKEFPRVITFGTGSCIPNKTRNVSANLIHVNELNCALLDCGEGTLGQIVRFYGRDGADEVLKNMKLIFVSHLHADHHLGLINILNRRRQVTKEKVLLLAPLQIMSWLSFYNYRIEEIFSTYDLFPCADLLGWNIEDEKREKLYVRLGLIKAETCYVKHCPHAFGVSLEMINPMKSERQSVKITYSGDTLPCDELVNIGMNSDILIHEATMEDDLVNEARIKMHSTVGQAIHIGQRMNAKFTILTHFSQRYAKIPMMDGNAENVSIGFDNMEVTLNDLPMMHLMYEPLKAMFSDHFEMMEQKSLKRKYQQDRKIEIDQPKGNQHNKIIKFNSSDEGEK